MKRRENALTTAIPESEALHLIRLMAHPILSIDTRDRATTMMAMRRIARLGTIEGVPASGHTLQRMAGAFIGLADLLWPLYPEQEPWGPWYDPDAHQPEPPQPQATRYGSVKGS